jgi:hypothetical protein
VAHWARQPGDPTEPLSYGKDGEDQAEELAIADAFANVEGEAKPREPEEVKKQEI